MRSRTLLIYLALAVPVDARDEKSAPGPTRVGLFERFEVSLTNPRPYTDPYRDVTLEARYRRPDGTEVRFWGFHNGGRVWKLRFLPDQLGAWRYEATFSDGAPGARGSFECVSSDVPGLIGAHAENPIWFGYRGDGPVLVRGLHVGDRFFASNFPDADRTAFLDWAQSQGYNLLSIASHYLNRDVKGRGRGWDTPDLWPLDAGEYRRMEAILDELARRRILVFPFAGFFGKNSDYPRDPGDQELYIRFTLARLAPYWNLLFSVAGPEPNIRSEWMPRREVERLGRLIRSLDPFGHLLSVHNRTGDDPYRDSDWSSYGVLQGPKTTDRVRLGRGLLRAHHPRKPLLAQETLWSGNVNHPDYSNSDLRKNAYVILMSGTNFVFADNRGNSSSGFSGSMDLSGRRQRRHDIIRKVWDFFESVPFHRMSPRPDLVDRGHCLAEPGHRYLVYMESAGTVNIDTQDGPFAVEWIDARDAEKRTKAGTTTDGRRLQPPEEDGDWLVLLTTTED